MCSELNSWSRKRPRRCPTSTPATTTTQSPGQVWAWTLWGARGLGQAGRTSSGPQVCPLASDEIGASEARYVCPGERAGVFRSRMS